MDSKKIRKSAGRLFGRLLLNICSLIIKIIPVRWVYGFAEGVAYLGYTFALKQRTIAVESLSIAFGNEKTRQEIERIAKDCFVFMAKSALELLVFMERPKLLKIRTEIAGRKNLDRAMSMGKGVILVSAHFGNFPVLLGRLSLEGYQTSAIMRHMRDLKTEKIFLKKREKFSVKTIYSQPRKDCVEQTIAALRNNELVFIPIDQNFGTAGVYVDFFGKKAATATGPVIFAQRTKAALLPCFILRQKDDTHKIIFEPALELEEGRNQEETVVKNIQKLTNIIEAYIRRYPAEWGWIHRRWKSRPGGEKGG